MRIQVVVDARERDAFRAQAAAEGRSLSEWLREAGRDRLAAAARRELRHPADLDRFFAECDQREQGREPDWGEHLEVIGRSRAEGLSPP